MLVRFLCRMRCRISVVNRFRRTDILMRMVTQRHHSCRNCRCRHDENNSQHRFPCDHINQPSRVSRSGRRRNELPALPYERYQFASAALNQPERYCLVGPALRNEWAQSAAVRWQPNLAQFQLSQCCRLPRCPIPMRAAKQGRQMTFSRPE